MKIWHKPAMGAIINPDFIHMATTRGTIVGRETPEGREWRLEMPGVVESGLEVVADVGVILINGKRPGGAILRYRLSLEGLSPEVSYKLSDGVLTVFAPKAKFGKILKGRLVR